MQFLIFGDPDFHCSGGSCLLHHQQSLQQVSGTQAGTQTCKRTQCTTHTDNKHVLYTYRESDLSRLMQDTWSITILDTLETFQFCLATSGQLPMNLSSPLARFRGLTQLPKKCSIYLEKFTLMRILPPASFRSIKLNPEFDKEVLFILLHTDWMDCGVLVFPLLLRIIYPSPRNTMVFESDTKKRSHDGAF